MKFVALLTINFLFGVVGVFSQTPPPAPPPPMKAAPQPDRPMPAETAAEDAEFDAKLEQSLNRPIVWKKFSPAGFDLSVDLPREPIEKQEEIYDESLGKVKMAMQLSIGDGVMFIVGRVVMPYKITDEKLLREMYIALAEGFKEEADFKFGEPKDFQFNDRLGVDLTEAGTASDRPPVRFRGVIVGQTVYMLASMPLSAFGTPAPVSKTDRDRMMKDADRFFGSAVLIKKGVPTSRPGESPVFSATFDGKTFRSEYFDFEFAPPPGWLNVDQDDVEGIRKVGKDIIAENTGKKLPTAKVRQNLTTFVSKPLGNENVAMIAFNTGLKGTAAADALKMAQMMEELLAKMPIYEIVLRPEQTKLGGLAAYRMETRIKLTESTQRQVIYFVPRRDFVLAITLTYFNDADRTAAMNAIEGLRFIVKGDVVR